MKKPSNPLQRAQALLKKTPQIAAIPAMIKGTTNDLLMFFLVSVLGECETRKILTRKDTDLVRDLFIAGAIRVEKVR